MGWRGLTRLGIRLRLLIPCEGYLDELFSVWVRLARLRFRFVFALRYFGGLGWRCMGVLLC